MPGPHGDASREACADTLGDKKAKLMVEYLTLKQLQTYSGRSDRWLKKRIRSKELKAVKFEPNGPWMIKKKWFDDFIEDQADAIERADARLTAKLKAKADSLWERLQEAS